MNIAHKPDVIYDPEHQKMHRLRDVEAENRQESQRIKIEALRAAAVVVAAQIAAGHGPLNINGKTVFWEQGVRWTAEQFRAWLSDEK